MDFKLFFDTDCDITPEFCKKYDAGLISMPYAIDDKEILPYVDFEKFDDKEFYSTLRKGVLPTTSALNVEEYIRLFKPVLESGKDILYIHFSRAMSATFNSCDKAIEELKKQFPKRRIVLIDTKGITLGSYSIDKQLGDLALAGKSIDEIVAASKEVIDHTAFYFYADNLKFFARSGRVTGIAALMGGIIGIKPIINIGDDGKMTSIDKAIGRKKALEKIMEYVNNLQEDIKNYPVIIAHCDCMHLVEELIANLKAKYGQDLHVEVEPVNPTAGSHCGPDCIGLTFHAKHR